MNEFEIIQNYFQKSMLGARDLILGPGDDAAVLAPSHKARVVCVDTLNENIHFPQNAAAADVGYKSLAVNLSDIAAMGATPQFALLALSIPNSDEKWLSEFARGFFELADQYKVLLIGGDLTRGPLSVSVTLIGEVGANYLTRSGAKVGDKIYVTGKLGGSGLALQSIKKNQPLDAYLHQRFYRPQPRIEQGLQLAKVATSCIDISDGLLGDLSHILRQSKVGAKLNLKKIPFDGSLDLALNAGEDYELCFTAALENELQFPADMICIGEIIAGDAKIVDENDQALKVRSFQHFG